MKFLSLLGLWPHQDAAQDDTVKPRTVLVLRIIATSAFSHAGTIGITGPGGGPLPRSTGDGWKIWGKEDSRDMSGRNGYFRHQLWLCGLTPTGGEIREHVDDPAWG